MTNETQLREEIKKEIPQVPKITGIYNDEEERWFKFSAGMEINGLSQISKFIRVIVKEITRIKTILGLEKIVINLEINIEGYLMELKIVIGKDTNKITSSAENIIKEIRRITGVLNVDSIKFNKIVLTF